jgi:hypothetical protein
MAVEREKFYEVEVKRRRLAEAGGYEPFWKLKSIAEALSDADTEFRCKDCYGEVKVLGKNSKSGGAPYAEHKSTADSGSCSNGLGFRRSTDGRESRLSENPVG